MKPYTLLLAAFGLTSACLLPHELKAEADYRLHGIIPKPRPMLKTRQSTRDMPIGKGDRFKDGTVVPRGLGVEDRDLGQILNVKEVESALKALAEEYNEVKLFIPPHTTYEKRSLHGAVIGDTARAFIMSGIHARERGGPDDVVYFIADLLQAKKAGTGLKYGGKTYTNKDVLKALAAGVVVLPLVNPDGVAYDQNTSSCWRKNRNPASATGDSDIGVDLNRNFDFLWDYVKAFSTGLVNWATSSDLPASEIFHGKAPLSEPETKNVAWVMDTYKQLSWFLDLHSYGGDVLFAWGDDNAQSLDATMNFNNSKYDGKRGIIGVDPENALYREFITTVDLDQQQSLAQRMTQEMSSAGPTRYEAKQSCELYPTSGTSADYALSRYYGHKCGASKIQGLTLEFGLANMDGGACPFYPNKNLYHQYMREVSVGLMEFLMNAAEEKVEVWKC